MNGIKKLGIIGSLLFIAEELSKKSAQYYKAGDSVMENNYTVYCCRIDNAVSEIQELRKELAASKPLLFKNMPQEWKDGRKIDVFHKGKRHIDCKFSCGGEKYISGFVNSYIFIPVYPALHVMLCPTIEAE